MFDLFFQALGLDPSKPEEQLLREAHALKEKHKALEDDLKAIKTRADWRHLLNGEVETDCTIRATIQSSLPSSASASTAGEDEEGGSDESGPRAKRPRLNSMASYSFRSRRKDDSRGQDSGGSDEDDSSTSGIQDITVIKAHVLILAGRSKYFKALFQKNGLAESQSRVVEVELPSEEGEERDLIPWWCSYFSPLFSLSPFPTHLSYGYKLP